MSLDGFSLSLLITELNQTLTGGRIDRIYQPDKHTLTLLVRQLNETIRLLISIKPENPCMYISAALPENPAAPPAFCMLLRKHLEDGRIASLTQHGLDRTVFIDIDVRNERGELVTKRLVVELMGKHSNIIFTQNNLIVDAIRRIGANVSSYRQVLPGRQYEYPPGPLGHDLLRGSIPDFITQLSLENDLSLAKAIVKITSGIGPVTAREIVWRSGLPADIMVDVLDKSDLAAVSEAIYSIRNLIQKDALQPSLVMDATNRIVAMAAFKLEHLTAGQRQTFPTMSQLLEFTSDQKGIQKSPEKIMVEKLLTGEISKQKRKLAALTAELADANACDQLRLYADILMAHLYQSLPARCEQIILPNIYSTTEGDTMIIPLDPSLSVLENAQVYYGKYNKLKRAQDLLAEQLSHCRQEIAYLESIQVALADTSLQAELAEIKQELTQAGYIKPMAKRRSPTAPTAPLQVASSNGAIILIGKNNRQNDALTCKQARPDDLWFHAKDIPGSHVILRTETVPPPEQTIREAAQLAAYFSKARQSANVPVDFTKRRHVKKPSGAKPGFVIYDHQKTLYVTPPDEQTVQQKLKETGK